MKIWLALLFLCFINGRICAQRSPEKARLLQKLDSCGLRLVTDSSFAKYSEVKIDTASYVKYDYAITGPTREFEVRYKIVPLTHATSLEVGSNFTMAGSDLVFRASVAKVNFDISQNATTETQDLAPQAVKNDLNAAMVIQCFLKPNPGFGSGFRIVYNMSYYKQDKAIVFVFYLFNEFDKDKFGKMIADTYKIVKFR